LERGKISGFGTSICTQYTPVATGYWVLSYTPYITISYISALSIHNQHLNARLFRRPPILLALPQLLLHTSAHAALRRELLPNAALLMEWASNLLCRAANCAAGCEMFPDGSVG